MLTLLLLLQVSTPPAQRPAQLTQFLQHSIGFSAEQLAAVERGEPVVSAS